MNVALWILQVLLALHTVMGAVWKFSNPAEKAIPSLKAIPQPVWISMCVIELILSVCLILPALNKSLDSLVPIAAVCIAAEMLIFCAVHLSSGVKNHSPIVYWSVVAAICSFVAFGRSVLYPL